MHVKALTRSVTVLCVLMLTTLCPAHLGAVETIGNGIYEAHVQSESSGDAEQFGSWNVVTGPAHPAGPDRDVLFTGSLTETNFSTLRIYRADGSGVDYTLGPRGGGLRLEPHLETEGPSPLAPVGQGWRTEWILDEEGLRIVQDVLVVGDSFQDSAVYHTVTVDNLGPSRVRIGWRNLYDWTLTGVDSSLKDGPANRLETACGEALFPATRNEFLHSPVSAGFVRVSLPDTDYEPLVSLSFDPGFRSDLPATTPDEYAHVPWPAAEQTAFEYPVGSATNMNGSAGLFWFGRDVSRSYGIDQDESVRFTQVLFAFPPKECPEPVECTQVPYGLVGWWPFDEPNQPSGGRFEDIARNHDGIARFTPEAIDGMVGGAARFDGQLDEVVVQDAPDLDMPSGVDFSIDFWIRTPDSAGVDIVLEKRTFAPDAQGYVVFLFNGELGLQLADGSGSSFCSFAPTSACTNYVSDAFVADGEWHLAAITVNRNDPQGVRFYLDGEQVGPALNSAVRNGSLANDAQLLIGGGDQDAPAAGDFFLGDLDELEIARRLLTPAEIRGIFEAGRGGKCKLTVDAPWDQPLCEDQNSVQPQITVCNQQITEGRFVFSFEGLPVNPPGVPHGSLCDAAGPTQFVLQGTQPLVIAPGECRTAEVRIFDPPAQTQGLASCYQVTAVDVVTGISRTDFGFIPASNLVCCRPQDPVVGGRPGEVFDLPFQIEDTGLGTPSFQVDLEVFGPDDATPDGIRLVGAEPGEPITREVTFGADGRAEVTVQAELTDDFAPLTFYDVVLSSDFGGGERQFLASTSILPTTEPCTQGLSGLCLNQERFDVRARWRTAQGTEGVGQAVPLTSDTGFYWFFEDSNLELVVKVLDACSFADRFWVFAGGLTNVEVELTVVDTVTGEEKVYFNPLGTPFQPVQDTNAFATCDAGDGLAGEPEASTASVATPSLELAREIAQAQRDFGLAEPVTELTLNDERFQVEVEWATTQGTSGLGQGVPITSDTGYFWFFDETNVELVVKVLDACSFANRFWVFAGGLTNVDVNILVTDTQTGETQTYSNPQETPFQPIQDTNAFATCP